MATIKNILFFNKGADKTIEVFEIIGDKSKTIFKREQGVTSGFDFAGDKTHEYYDKTTEITLSEFTEKFKPE